MSSKSFGISALLAVALIGLFFWFLSQISLVSVWDALSGANLSALALSFGLYLVSGILKALRFQRLMRTDWGWIDWFRLSSLQNALNVFFPLRAGEWYYVAALKTGPQVSVSESLSALVAVRLIDAIVVLSICVLALSGALAFAAPKEIVQYAGIVLMVCIAALLILLRYTGILKRRLEEMRVRVQYVPVKSILRALEQLMDGFSTLRERQFIWTTALYSVGIWAVTFISASVLLSALHADVSMLEAIAVYGFPTIISMTPAFMFGGVGAYEASIIFPLMMFGITRDRAIVLALTAHVYELSFLLIALFLSIVLHLFLSKKRI
ncbi:MAG: lysylphosphatidylglycerol synthase transmembrane domain-containing protein [Patescibacteria group bacterium]